MSAVLKTQSLRRENLVVGLLVVNEVNPNAMSEIEFNLLVDNIEKMGITDAILVRPLPNGKYRVIGGAHRLEAAKLLGFETVPCTIVMDPEFDEDMEKFQIVRMNVIRGKMTPESFMKLYDSLNGKYAAEVMADAFGFADEKEFRKLVKSVEKDLPADMKETFKDAAKNVKNIDDLSLLLNNLFSKYGDTLDHGYMLLEYGGKDSIWIRITDKTRKELYAMGDACRTHSVTMDDMLAGLIAQATPEVLQSIAATAKKVVIPSKTVELPTAEFLDSLT